MTETFSPLTATGLRVELDRQTVIPGLDFQVRQGLFTAIVGPNGCGKSTLLRTLIRLLTPVAGRVELDGRDMRGRSARDVARRVALLPQSASAPSGISVRDLVARGRYPHQGLLRQWSRDDERAVDGALTATGLIELADRLVEDLSGGQRQRAWVAMVLAQQTTIALLDEPTTFLDIAHQYALLELVRELVATQGRTIVAVLHDLQQAARYADHLVVMKDGNIIVEGPPRAVLTPDLVTDVFGITCRLITDERTGAVIVVPDALPRPDVSMIPPLNLPVEVG
ncbi:ABC transporter ATP-binding protein [Nocardia uniformis]|uniref:ABC transporter ATP-binding protein n=1 Tax=Nocardia uniformis TaxID=53432 RepID=A0A849BQJ4_9NOCA|nr:ABC transporter ATP-binding protein [Nocardia uniformis]NNH68972.1 ABC transporter ATP-binding protein [Nocardia uniformis]